MYEGRTKDNIAFISNIDMDCSGQANATLYIPDDKAKPITLRMDTNKDGKTDAWILDEDRDGKWDISYWDTDFRRKPTSSASIPTGSSSRRGSRSISRSPDLAGPRASRPAGR